MEGIGISNTPPFETADLASLREVLGARRVQLAAWSSPNDEDTHTGNELAELAECLIRGRIEQFTTPWVAKRAQETLGACTQDPTETKALAEAAKEFSDLLTTVSGDLADGDVSDNDLARAQREGGELVAKVQALLGQPFSP